MTLEVKRYEREVRRPRFGTCIFPIRPECGNVDTGERHGCSAGGWELIKCYLDHYGNKLSPDAEVRLMDAFVHLLVNNFAPDAWELESSFPLHGRRPGQPKDPHGK